MVEGRRQRSLDERARGVGLVVAVGAAVLLAGLAVIAVFVWVMT